MADLRQEHLGESLPPGSFVRAKLEEAYQSGVRKGEQLGHEFPHAAVLVAPPKPLPIGPHGPS
jgi:hypothetical protein